MRVFCFIKGVLIMFKNFSKIVAMCAAITCGSSWGIEATDTVKKINESLSAGDLVQAHELLKNAFPDANIIGPTQSTKVNMTATLAIDMNINEFATIQPNQSVTIGQYGVVTDDDKRTVEIEIKKSATCYIAADTFKVSNDSKEVKVQYDIRGNDSSQVVLKEGKAKQQITFDKGTKYSILVQPLNGDNILEAGAPLVAEDDRQNVDGDPLTGSVTFTISAE